MMKLKLLATFSLCLAIEGIAKPNQSVKIGDAQPALASTVPEQIKDVGITEHLGTTINLESKFQDEQGDMVPLSQYFNQGRPVLISFVYYSCANLCNFHLTGVTEALSKFPWLPSEKYTYLFISIDPKETPELARAKKADLLKFNPTNKADIGWHFLTSPDDQVKTLSHAMGFDYKWSEEQKEWAHGAGAFVLSEKGLITRILYGIEFKQDLLKLSMVEASDGKVGSFLDHVLLFCYHYDPQGRKYSLRVVKIMQAGGGLAVLFLLFLLAPVWMRNFRKHKIQGEV